MIKKIDEILYHWADKLLIGMDGVGVSCALAWDGMPKGNSTRAGLAAIYNVQLDELAAAVDMAVFNLPLPVSVGGLGARYGNELKELIRVRYLIQPQLLVEQQMVKLSIKSDRTYRNKLHQLHVFIENALNHSQLLSA